MDSVKGSTQYTKIRSLNTGSFGFVEVCKDNKSGHRVAIKFISRGKKITKYVLHEILNHSRLKHPHVVAFKEVFLTPKYLAIVMDFVPGGDLFDYVSQRHGLTEDNARWLFQQMIVGIDYLHKMGLAYRDVKLENTLLDNSPKPLLKICDFGYSKHAEYQSAARSRVGSPAYIAPEVILCSQGGNYDGKIADIWSCGVMLFVMLVGGYPFERHGDLQDHVELQKWMQRILRLEYAFPQHIQPSMELRDLLSKILVIDPKQRATLIEIQAHPWYQKNLPAGVSSMNERLSAPTILQTEAELRKMVAEAEKELEEEESKETASADLNRSGLTDEWGQYS